MPKSVQDILSAFETSAHLAWILEATDEQLDEYISKVGGNEVLHRAALSERARRQFKHLSKPHWTITPGFIIGFLAMVFAAIAAWPVIREWIQFAPPANTGANFQPPRSNSVPTTTATSSTSPPAVYVNPSTPPLKK